MKYKVYTKEQGLIETNNCFDFDNLTLHKEDGPALIKYYSNGNIEREAYYVNDVQHRLDGPAIVEYYDNGNIKYEDYRKDGVLHRLDGPAYINYDKLGNITETKYGINNKYYTFEEWKEHPFVKAKTIEVNSKKELDALAKKDKEGTKTDDYFISSTGKYPVIYTLKESKVFESFKDAYIKK